jgi:Na+(H+)/acetate symporter ActP
MSGVNVVELAVFTLLFVFVAVMGFMAARWKSGDTMDHLDEWGLGGRKFGGWITWFLVGGDLYTAYTFVAVPALVFGAGAIGFFALPYTVILYPIVFLPLLRLWSVSRSHGYVTPADYVRGRYGSPGPVESTRYCAWLTEPWRTVCSSVLGPSNGSGSAANAGATSSMLSPRAAASTAARWMNWRREIPGTRLLE